MRPSTKLGQYATDNNFLKKHIKAILALPLVDVEAIRAHNFRVVVDAVNSSGGFRRADAAGGAGRDDD